MLRCRLLAAPLAARINELLIIAESFYAVEHKAKQMSVGGRKSVNAVHTSNHKQQHQKKTTLNNHCGNCTKLHAPGCANCPAQDSDCNRCGHIGHWKSKCLNNHCGNCTKCHAPGCANCPAQDSDCNRCGHIGHWKSKCREGAPLNKQNGKTQHPKKGQKPPWEEGIY